MIKKHTANIDVMVNGGRTHYRSLRYPYCPLFRVTPDDLLAWLIDKLPSLKWRKDAVVFVNFQDGGEYEIRINN